MPLLLLDADAIRTALPMDAAIETARDAFRAVSAGEAVGPPRTAIDSPAGTTLLMGARVGEALAAKVVSVFPGNAARGRPAIGGLVLLLDPESGEPSALLDGRFLTAWRTGAAGGAAADALARQDARVACVFGAGAQARTQALALDRVRALAELRIVARRPEAAAALARELAPELRATCRAGSDPLAALEDADVVVTATSAREPLFPGERLPAGAHVTAIGSFRPGVRELDERAVGAARVFVDSRVAALVEAGDLLAAREAGTSDPAQWVELGEVLAGRAEGRRSSEERTLFKSVGLPAQDATAAAAAVRRARECGLGTELAL